ncbi:putative methyltransferase PMT2 [Artemisia annua]|uniref:Methyltransferase n=1 Tax=Artemisia annua TaxID=35608 RepID=A0A2U1KMF2_ARTAN|nr:putative methyltransferase PMT2 [Artemisia annua]
MTVIWHFCIFNVQSHLQRKYDLPESDALEKRKVPLGALSSNEFMLADVCTPYSLPGKRHCTRGSRSYYSLDASVSGTDFTRYVYDLTQLYEEGSSFTKEALEWLDENQSDEKKEYDEKLKEVETVCNPIITAVYQRTGGAPGGATDSTEDNDCVGHWLWSMSFAPRDSHEAQVQFALKRGFPAIIGVLGTIKLPYPSRSFDMAHCSQCLKPWGGYIAMYMMEVDRVLRHGGYWVLSGPPINWKTNVTATLIHLLLTVAMLQSNYVTKRKVVIAALARSKKGKNTVTFTFSTAVLGNQQEYSRTIVIELVVDDFIQPDGWLPWQGTFALDTCFYGEYANVGLGLEGWMSKVMLLLHSTKETTNENCYDGLRNSTRSKDGDSETDVEWGDGQSHVDKNGGKLDNWILYNIEKRQTETKGPIQTPKELEPISSPINCHLVKPKKQRLQLHTMLLLFQVNNNM